MTDVQQLHELIDRVVADHPDEAASGALAGVWPTLVELGLPTVGVPESVGGSGGGLDDVLALVEALGRHGMSTPLVESTVANWVLGACGLEPMGLTTIAVPGARLEFADGTVTGELCDVGWARVADAIVVLPERSPAFIAYRSEAGVTVRPRANVAGEPRDAVHLARCRFQELAGAPEPAAVRARLGLLWTAAMTGAAAGSYELTRRYVCEREQFGQPLVRLSAVANALATMRIQVSLIRAGLDRGQRLWRIGAPATDLWYAAAAARVTAAGAATQVAQIAHQLHGAIGITAEYALHRRTRRLWAWRDVETPEHEWAVQLGATVLADGEPALWERISA